MGLKDRCHLYFQRSWGPHPHSLALRRSKTHYPRAWPQALALAIGLYGGVFTWTAAVDAQQKTVRDKVYSKAQADKAEAQFTKVCANCHDPAKVAAGKRPAPQLIGDKFLDKWKDKTLGELMTLIATSMPDDGSVVLSDQDAADLVAYLLKANGFPDGPNALAPGDASKDIVIVKPSGH